jgi:hypothetical protein
MPALILEAGMIVNRDKEEMLSKPTHSATIAKRLSMQSMNSASPRMPVNALRRSQIGRSTRRATTY